jgi:hypothetical protein
MKKVLLALIALTCTASLCFAQAAAPAAAPAAKEKKGTQGIKAFHIFPKEKAPKQNKKKAGEEGMQK